MQELEDTLHVHDVEDLRELSESMYEGLATTGETHTKLREIKRGIVVISLPRLPPLTQLSVHDSHPRAAVAAEKGKRDLKEGLYNRSNS